MCSHQDRCKTIAKHCKITAFPSKIYAKFALRAFACDFACAFTLRIFAYFCVFCSCIFALLHLFDKDLSLAKFCKIHFLCMSYYRLIIGLFLVLCARLWFGGVWISVQNGQK